MSHAAESLATRATTVIARCRELARITDIPNQTTRLFLSPATRDAHTLLEWWIRQANLTARTDDAGNIRATRHSAHDDAPTFVLFSHIDTVTNAGAFDGPLGVLLSLAAIEQLGATPLPFHIELIAFAEEEGVRFGFPFLSSLATTGQLTPEHLARTDADGISVAQAISAFGLDPTHIPTTCPLAPNTFGALEVHIEQGPVLEKSDSSLAVVEAIVGQSRLELTFEGHANHAGTTPMSLRQDALAAAAQWIVEVERYAANYTQLVATVGRISSEPGAINVIPGTVRTSLDIRHPKDESRHAAIAHLLTKAEAAGALRGVRVHAVVQSEQRAVPMNRDLTVKLHQAAERAGFDAQPIFSGAGHDAMILAASVPTTMLFLRSPGGLSHHPDEDVRLEDVEAALATVLNLLLHLHPHKT
ncbi:MAG TPA: allantoate amidohydrolase [Acidobacteriaceae bacterium]|nr:allantoate amidohydrolase [Acidobacteriaceae bacterium]